MNKNKFILSVLFALMVVAFSCKDESLYPLPYNDRTTSAYLRIYSQTSNILDIANLANAGLDAIYEPVDVNGGNDLASVEFFVSHRRGTNLTPEAFVKSVDASVFADVPEPTFSEYKRARIRVTGDEILTALRTLTADPDGEGLDTNGNGRLGDDECPRCVPLKGLAPFIRNTSAIYPGGDANLAPGNILAGDQVNIRYELVMKDGRRISVANPQTAVNPNTPLANIATANSTPNITTGLFYNSPFVVILTARNMLPATWVGNYNLTQTAIWSPSHSWDFHVNYPQNLREILFPNQTVDLQPVPGGLTTERQFSVQYKGQTVTLKINLEHTPTTANPNLGTVFVPLQNSTVDCSSERELYWVTPTAGTFAQPGTSTVTFTAPLPSGPNSTGIANRGTFANNQTGLVSGQVMTIGLDDDADEYGRRNGYCTWTRRVVLTLTRP